MTIEIIQFKCPLCRHELGEQEYTQVCERNDKLVKQRIEEGVYQQKIQDDKEKQQQKTQHDEEMRRLQEQHDLQKEKEVNIRAQEILKQEKVWMELKHKQELVDQVKQAVAQSDAKHLETEKINELKLKRLEAQLEKQQKIIDSTSPELRGTAGEFILLDVLQKEFPRDNFTTKKNGKPMSDIIQEIVTEKGEINPTPIVYDVKMGDKVTKSDIAKAKNYMCIHKTPHSIIVTKDIKSEHYTEVRDGILLVHPLAVIDIAQQLRKSLIETGILIRNNTNRNTKESKMYAYFTSQVYTRNLTERIELKLKYDNIYKRAESLRKQEYSCVEKLVDLDNQNDAIIMDIAQDDTDIQNWIDSIDDPKYPH